VLDEPTGGLDPNGVRRLREIITSEAADGTTVFFSSHVLGQVRAVADRVGIMNRGELVAVDTIDGLRSELDIGARVTLDVDAPAQVTFADDDAVTDVTCAEETVRATCLEPGAKLRLLDRVRESTRVTDVRIEESSLEDLFASYTGTDTETETRAGGATVETNGAVPAESESVEVDG